MRYYERKINYYETDQMAIVHHSNYIRYFEEARVSFMEQAGYPYERLEAEEILSPVINVSCKFLRRKSMRILAPRMRKRRRQPSNQWDTSPRGLAETVRWI